MANHRSAIKRHTQSLRKQTKNVAIKSALKTATKKVRTATESGNATEAAEFLKQATSLFDGAVTKGTLHRNNASRKVSRLASAVNAIATK